MKKMPRFLFRFLHSPFSILHSLRRGQSLMEVVVGIAVGILMITAAVTVIGSVLRGATGVNQMQAGTALGKQLLEGVRVFAEADWHNIANLATSSANKYHLDMFRSPFVAVTGTENAPDVLLGLTGYWKFDEGTGTSTADSAGTNPGTLVNNPTRVVGKLRNALQFNATDNGNDNDDPRVKIGTNFDVVLPFTISAWVNPTNFNDWRAIFSKRDSTAASQMRVDVGLAQTGYGGGSGRVYVTTRTGITQYFSYAPPTGTWTHLTFMATATTTQLHVNGVFHDSFGGLTLGTKATANTVIGGTGEGVGGDNDPFKGMIDEVRVYNRALAQDEIAILPITGVLIRYFYLDDVARDAGGNIVTSGGANDPSTKKLTVATQWPGGALKTISTYLTRSRNVIFLQTDWSGGSGQDGPATTTNNLFASSSNINFTTTTGSLFIDLP